MAPDSALHVWIHRAETGSDREGATHNVGERLEPNKTSARKWQQRAVPFHRKALGIVGIALFLSARRVCRESRNSLFIDVVVVPELGVDARGHVVATVAIGHGSCKWYEVRCWRE